MTDEGTPYGQRLSDLAAATPDEVVLTFVPREGDPVPLTLAQLDATACRLARAMAARGVALGDRVALELPNSITLVAGAFAAWKLGAIPVPMRWDLPEWERQRLLDVVAATLVVNGDSVDALAGEAAGESSEPLPVALSPGVNGICSSGSTGTPKVIVSRLPALWTEAISTPFMAAWRPVPRPQRILVPAPLYHTNGFATLAFILGGDRLVLLEKFDAELVLDLIERHRITTFTATPTMLQRIAQVPEVEKRDLSSIDWVMQGAAVMPPALMRTWFDLIGAERVVIAYGMTEQLGLTALRGSEWLEHPGSVGRGFRETEIKILGEDGKELPVGEVGDVYLRSPNTGLYEYLGGAPLLPVNADGFSTGGDVGSLDADGYLVIVDRRVDMIITGGANVYPAEVESALSEHPAIRDVVVLGIKDPQWGRRVHAVVETLQHAGEITEADVIAFAKSRLAPYKVPKSVEFGEIPRSAATKVSRSAMVAQRGG